MESYLNNDIQGVISSIKSKLLSFMLELVDEIGEYENVNIMEHKKSIDKLFDQTIGNISGQNINLTIGKDNLQLVNSGEAANINVAKGKDISQRIDIDASKKLGEFIDNLKSVIDQLSLSSDDRIDLLAEISRVETQLQRKEPKLSIVNGALNTINGILIGVAGNALTQPILEQLGLLIRYFAGHH